MTKNYVDEVDRVTTIVMDRSGNIVDMYLADSLRRDQAVALLTTTTLVGAARGAALADSHFAWSVAKEYGAPVAALGLTALIESPKVQQIIDNLLDTAEEQITTRVRRFTGSQVTYAAASTYSRAVEKSPFTNGWTRELEPKACELCEWWARNGRVWPKTHYMPTHHGCRCRPAPVVSLKKKPLSQAAHDRSTADRETRKQLVETGYEYQ